jgi:hypothetical protein
MCFPLLSSGCRSVSASLDRYANDITLDRRVSNGSIRVPAAGGGIKMKEGGPISGVRVLEIVDIGPGPLEKESTRGFSA